MYLFRFMDSACKRWTGTYRKSPDREAAKRFQKPMDTEYQYDKASQVESSAPVAEVILPKSGDVTEPFGVPSWVWLNALKIGTAGLLAVPQIAGSG
jgi:hypothetical protein